MGLTVTHNLDYQNPKKSFGAERKKDAKVARNIIPSGNHESLGYKERQASEQTTNAIKGVSPAPKARKVSHGSNSEAFNALIKQKVREK